MVFNVRCLFPLSCLLPLLWMLHVLVSAEDLHYTLLRAFKHDRASFTQGLVNYNGYIYESAGLYGRSSLRIVDPESGKILKMVKLDKRYFAEGIAIVNNRVHMLTYHEKQMLIFDASSLELQQTLHISTATGEGWGLTTDGKHLIASDGSELLSVYEIPSSTQTEEVRKVKEIVVKEASSGRRVNNINELQFVDGYVYANVWFKDVILKIDYATGLIEHTYNMATLYPSSRRGPHVDVFNGICYNASDGTFLVTGKLWPRYYHLKLTDFSSASAKADLRASMLL